MASPMDASVVPESRASNSVNVSVHLFGILLCASALMKYVPEPDLSTAIFGFAFLALTLYALASGYVLSVLLTDRIGSALVGMLLLYLCANIAVASFHQVEFHDFFRGVFPFLFLSTFFLFDIENETDRNAVVAYLLAAAAIWGLVIVHEVGFQLYLDFSKIEEFSRIRIVQIEPNTVLPFALVAMPFILLTNRRLIGLLLCTLTVSIMVWSGYRAWLLYLAVLFVSTAAFFLLHFDRLRSEIAWLASAFSSRLTLAWGLIALFGGIGLILAGAEKWSVALVLAILLAAVLASGGKALPTVVNLPVAMIATLFALQNDAMMPLRTSIQAFDSIVSLADDQLEPSPYSDIPEIWWGRPIDLQARRLEAGSLATDSRIDEIRYALEQFADSPLFGKGLGWQVPAQVTFPEDVRDAVVIEHIPDSAGYLHNLFAYLLMTCGLLGLILYCLPLTVALLRSRPTFEAHYAAVMLSMLGLFLSANVSASFRLVQFNLMAVVILKLVTTFRAAPSQSSP